MNKHLRKLIGHQRQKMGLNFRELAELCGLNPQKWANKICNFEREGVGSDEMIRKLIQVLQIDLDEVRDANKKDLDDWNKWLAEKVPMELVLKPNIGIYLGAIIPDEIDNQEKALEYAASMAKEYKSEACLILNRRESIWLKRDGSLKFETTDKTGILATPYMSVGNKQFVFGMTQDVFKSAS
jgi:hypothetical protein